MKSLRSVGKFPNIRKKVQLSEKQFKTIIEKLSRIRIKSYDKQYSIKEKELNKEEDTHGYERGELNRSGGESMGFEGWGSDSISSTGDGGDFSSPSFNRSSDIFNLKESLHKNLKKFI